MIENCISSKWSTLTLLAGLALINAMPSGAVAEIEPSAAALVKAVADKLASAQTIKLTATHKLDPALALNARLGRGPIQITVKRPNQCYVLQAAGEETREMVYDGKTFCFSLPELKVHSIQPLKAASIEQFADAMDERFGFRPPVAELLSEDMPKQLLLNVTSARVVGTEWVGWTRCERLHFEQEGMTGDLWVGRKDRLPRRYLLTFTDVSGQPAWDIRLTKWELNVPVEASLFARRPGNDSQSVPMLRSR